MAVWNHSSVTAAANTAFTMIVPSSGDGIPVITELLYETAGTPHTLTFMRPIGATTVLTGPPTGIPRPERRAPSTARALS